MSTPTERLRRLLVEIPREIGYKPYYVLPIRLELRRAIFSLLSMDNKYASLFFDECASHSIFEVEDLPPADQWFTSDQNKPLGRHTGRPCVRKFHVGEPTYRCLSCGLDETCVLCANCFNEEDHVSHDVVVKITYREDSGICDCGDKEAWTCELHCKADSIGVSTAQENEPPSELKENIFEILQTLLDFCIDVLCCAHSGVQFVTDATHATQNAKESEFDENIYGPEDISGADDYILTLWNDERRSFVDAAGAIRKASNRPQQFALIIANRIDLLGRAVVAESSSPDKLIDMRKSFLLFTSVLRTARDYIREEMVNEIFKILLRLASAQLKGVHPSFFPDLIGKALLNPWRVGNKTINNGGTLGENSDYPSRLWRDTLLSGFSIPRPSPPRQKQSSKKEDDEEDQDAPVTISKIMAYRSQTNSFQPQGPSSIWCPEDDPQKYDGDIMCSSPGPRVQYLIFFDMRLWKSLRITLNELYLNTLVTNLEYKRQLGSIYADIYPQFAQMYVLLDREYEVSIISSLSTQLFTTPTIATEILTNKVSYARLLATLYTLYCFEKVCDPSKITNGSSLSNIYHIFRNRRVSQIFHEIEFLFNRNTDQKHVIGSTESLTLLADFLSLFQGLYPLKRVTGDHVEYENDTWMYVFATMPVVLQLAHAAARGALSLTFNEVREPIKFLCYYLMLSGARSNMARATTSITVNFGDSVLVRDVYEFSVDLEVISFHHPLHAFLSWLIEYSNPPSRQALRQVLFSHEEYTLNERFSPSALFDSSIRTLAVLSQIHVGLWVRNGYNIRNQLHHYRDFTLRDLAFVRDVFITQTALVVLDTNTAVMQLLYRWHMLDWSVNPLFDETQRFYMLEEYLHTLTYLLMDRVFLQGLDDVTVKNECFKREIIQCLAFGDMSFSGICKYVPDSMTSDAMFDHALREYADYIPPKDVRDVGRYSLKPVLFREFNPHYIHFVSARIEEAETMFAEKMSKILNCRPEEVCELPPMTELKGAWGDLGAFTRSVSFARFVVDLFSTLLKMMDEHSKANVETVLGKALYLLLVAAQDDLQRDYELENKAEGVFPSMVAWVCIQGNSEGLALVSYIRKIMETPQLSSLHPRCSKLLQLLRKRDSTALREFTVRGHVNEPADREFDKRREFGRKIQESVLEEFKKKQEQFLERQRENNPYSDGIDDEGKEDEISDLETPEYWSFPSGPCVLCRMPGDDEAVFGLMTRCSPVRVLRECGLQTTDSQWISAGYAGFSSLDTEKLNPEDISGTKSWNEFWKEESDVLVGVGFPREKTKITPAVVGCGHGIHYKCYQEFLNTQLLRSQSQQLTRVTPEVISKGEYLCPLCQELNNGFTPILWDRNYESCDDLKNFDPSEFQKMYELESGDMQVFIARLVESGRENTIRRFREMIESDVGSVSGGTDSISLKRIILAQVSLFDQVVQQEADTEEGGLSGIRLGIDCYTYTVSMLEISLRGEPHNSPFGGILVDQVPTKTVKFLRVLTQFIRLAISLFAELNWGHFQSSQITAASLFRFPSREGILDPFMELINALFVIGPAANISKSTILRMFYMATILQFLQSTQEWRTDQGFIIPTDQLPEDLREPLKGFCSHPDQIYGMLARYVTIFLRRAALVIFGFNGAYDKDEFACMMGLPEHERLCLYLHLPKLGEMIRSLADQESSVSWAAGRIANYSFSPLEYAGVYTLIRLPLLLNMFYVHPNAKRLKNERVQAEPCVCLFCGEVFRVNHKLEFEEPSAANQHLAHCYKVYAMFLLPRQNRILLLTPDGRGTFLPAPYLDLHGELDEVMRRMKPHHLQPKRYTSLTRSLWLEHGLVSFIARKLDQVIDNGGWDTF